MHKLLLCYKKSKKYHFILMLNKSKNNNFQLKYVKKI